MAYDSRIVNQILAEYEQTRVQNNAKRKQRIQAIYSNLPRIEEIDIKINQLGFEQTQKIIENPLLATQYKQEFKSALSLLQKERNDLLESAGFSISDMELHYTCEKCEDTGYINNKKCNCFQQKIINSAYENSNFGRLLQEQNFDTFSFDYYSNQVIANEGISPLDRIRDIYNISLGFVKYFDNPSKSLLFYGGSGLGKTFLSSCIAKELLDCGKTVIYTRSTRLFSLYEDYKFGRTEISTTAEYIDQIFNVDLLIIDDLGTEQQTKTTLPFLFDILNTRLSQDKKMIISTNFLMNELSSTYSARLTSRIYEYFTPLKFLGNDIRVTKMVSNKQT